ENTLHEFAGADSNSGNFGFAPHVTLARINQSGLRGMDVRDLPVIEESVGRTFLVESVEVMESELKRGGPDYAILESLRLGGD
ncbi:MAG: hypothetical protein MUD10_04385, partial [Candidatus Pacebacteria bacterium]|nr:hypothetical protein [Candidatus Paceibacterota bacterium]